MCKSIVAYGLVFSSGVAAVVSCDPCVYEQKRQQEVFRRCFSADERAFLDERSAETACMSCAACALAHGELVRCRDAEAAGTCAQEREALQRARNMVSKKRARRALMRCVRAQGRVAVLEEADPCAREVMDAIRAQRAFRREKQGKERKEMNQKSQNNQKELAVCRQK